MDRRRTGAARRRRVRAGLALAGLAALALLWQPVEGLLVSGLSLGAEIGLAILGGGAGEARAEEEALPVSGPQGLPRGPWQPTFEEDGRLRVPEDYREWVFVGAALGLSYSEGGPVTREHDDPGSFTHVYVDPDTLAEFRASGSFREGATFMLDMHAAASGESIARDGWFEGARTGVHAAVKDSARFVGGWGYFNVGPDGRGRLVRSDGCRSCHVAHGAVDNVFVQFYPLLRDIVSASETSASGMR